MNLNRQSPSRSTSCPSQTRPTGRPTSTSRSPNRSTKSRSASIPRNVSKLNLNPTVRVQRLISSSKGGVHLPAPPVAHTEPFCHSADDVQMFGLDPNDAQEESTPAFQTWWRDMTKKRALLDESSVDKRSAIAETAGHLAQSDQNTGKLPVYEGNEVTPVVHPIDPDTLARQTEMINEQRSDHEGMIDGELHETAILTCNTLLYKC